MKALQEAKSKNYKRVVSKINIVIQIDLSYTTNANSSYNKDAIDLTLQPVTSTGP